jgi:hypothetical protein
MPGVGSDHKFAAIYYPLAGRRRPPRMGCLTTRHVTPFSHKFIPCPCSQDMNGMPEILRAPAASRVTCPNTKRRAKLEGNTLDFSHSYKVSIVMPLWSFLGLKD